MSVLDASEKVIAVDNLLRGSDVSVFALPGDVARLRDVVDIFGAVSMQACLMEQTSNRSCYRLVGRSHDIAFWPVKDTKLPQLEHFRPYYPEELYPSEKIWLPSVFEPVRLPSECGTATAHRRRSDGAPTAQRVWPVCAVRHCVGPCGAVW